MDQTYIVGKPAAGGLRPCLYRYGNFCYIDNVSVSRVDSLSNLPKLLQELQAIQSDMTFFSEFGSLPDGSEQSTLLSTLEEAVSFIVDEIMGSESALEEALAANDWIDAESSNIYFEFEVVDDYKCHTADIIISKRYIKSVMLTVVLFEGKFLVTLADAEKEQPLVDTLFPHVSGRRRGFQVRAYDHRIFTKLSLWQAEDASRAPSPEPPPEPIPTVDMSGEGYTQTYIVMRPKHLDEGSTRRDVFFRFGSWCYAGQVDLGVDALHLGDVPEVLPALQRQQAALSFMCETAAVPVSSPYAPVLGSYTSALAFFQDEIIASEEKLSEMAALGVTAWIEEDWGAAFFELKCLAGADFGGVELVAAKTYFRGIVLHSVLFAGSLYAVLADADDDQPLLDVAFPDVTARCRGYQIKTYNNAKTSGLAPRRLSVWEGRRKGSAGVGWGASAAITTASILGQDVTKLKHTPTKDKDGAGGGKTAEAGLGGGAGSIAAQAAAAAARRGGGGGGKAADDDDAGAAAATDGKSAGDDEAAARAARLAAEREKAAAKRAADKAERESKAGDGADGAGGGSAAGNGGGGTMAGVKRLETTEGKSSADYAASGGGGGGGGGSGGGSGGAGPSSPATYGVRAPHHLKPMGEGGGGLGGSPAGGRLSKLAPVGKLGDLGPAPWDAGGRPVLGKKPLLK